MSSIGPTTIDKGNLLEDGIHTLFAGEIEKGRFWAKKSCCKIFRKEGYFSKDRQKNIVFDISVENSLPDTKEYSVTTCRTLNSSPAY